MIVEKDNQNYIDNLMAPLELDLTAYFSLVLSEVQRVVEKADNYTYNELGKEVGKIFEKIYIDRTKKKYGISKIAKGTYQEVVDDIVYQNSMNVQERIGKIKQKHFITASKKLETKEFKIVVPDYKKVLPRKDITALVSKVRSSEITQTLKNRIDKNLQFTLKQYTKKTGLLPFFKKPDEVRAMVKKELIYDLQKSMLKTFKSYTKKDPSIGVPGNIRNIAVTEARFNIELIKKEYMNKYLTENPNLEATKQWVQNRSMAKKPRKSHTEINKTIINYNEKFVLNNYKSINGQEVLSGINYADRPHDPNLPLNQKIGCNCEIIYRIRKKI